MFSFDRRLIVAFVLMLAVSAQATAITVYDVIQLSKKSYSDQDIIALIEATDSAFELKADDIVRLVELGVNEPVIQAMLKAVPAEPPVGHAPDTAPGQYATSPADKEPGSGTAITFITSDKLVPRAFGTAERARFRASSPSGHHSFRNPVVCTQGRRRLSIRDSACQSGGRPSQSSVGNG